MTTQEQKDILLNFAATINMSAQELDSWLQTDESKQVAQQATDLNMSERQVGRRIVELLKKEESDYSDDDFAFMKQVIWHVRDRAGDRPFGSIRNTPWRSSLMNSGHDPTR